MIMNTIRDVAKRAGVSVGTVSAVINDKAPVSRALRERVLQAIAELDYQPNSVARSLKRNRTLTLGAIIPDITNPFYPEVALGIEDRAMAAGYHVLICNTGNNQEKEHQLVGSLTAKRVDGVIVGTARLSDRRLIDELRARRVHHVFINRRPQANDALYVGVDNAKAGRLAVEHLGSLGHGKIGCITGAPDLSTSIERYQGYLEEMTRRGLKVEPAWIKWGNYREDSGFWAATEILATPHRPTAIFAAGDLMALGAMKAARSLGLRIPEDLAVVGCDDIALSESFPVPLTTVHQPKYKMGELATEILLGLLQGGPPPDTRCVVLDPHLVVRQSCGS